MTTICERCTHEEGVHQNGVCRGKTKRNTDCYCSGFSPLIAAPEDQLREEEARKHKQRQGQKQKQT